MTRRRRWGAWALAGVLGVWGTTGVPRPALAQTWDATLFVTPFPSPYLSDWEINPNIASYTLVNGTGHDADVILRYQVRNQAGTVVTAGRSDPQRIPAGAPVIYTSFTDIAGATEHDRAIEDVVKRSGRMPEGDYTACVVATNRSGFVLASVCGDFTILYPDPPMLIAPGDGDVLTTDAPIFQWTPLQVPVDYTLHYALQVAELLPRQNPYTALTSNILHYENLDVGTTSLPYPTDGLPLTSGKTYAWRVVAIDQNGYAAATNGGSSEIWTFRYDDGGGNGDDGGVVESAPFTLSLMNFPDSLSPPSDTVERLPNICKEWNTLNRIDAIRIPVISKLVFPRTAVTPGRLVRKEHPNGHRVWAAVGTNATHTFLVYGDCDGLRQATQFRWVGVRKLSDSQELMAWLRGDTTIAADTAGEKVKFGVGIFSRSEMTVHGDSLDIVQEFLEDYSVDVQPGFNGFWVFDGNQSRGLKWIAEKLHTTTKDFEVQGFAGLNASYSAGVSVGMVPTDTAPTAAFRHGGFGADISRERTFFVARGALPAWKEPWGSTRIKSIQLGIELVIKDSTVITAAGLGADQKPAFDIVITPTLTVVTADDVTWKGSIGIDLARQGFLKYDPKLVVKLTTDKTWQPGLLAGTGFYLGNLEVELDVDEGLISAFRKDGGLGTLDWSLAVAGGLGWGNEANLAKLGATVGRKSNDPEKHWTGLLKRDSAQVQKDSLQMYLTQRNIDYAKSSGDERLKRWEAELEALKKQHQATLRQLQIDQRGYDMWKTASQGGKNPVAPTAAEKGAWWWRARLAFGNMSFGDFMDLMRKASVAARNAIQ